MSSGTYRELLLTVSVLGLCLSCIATDLQENSDGGSASGDAGAAALPTHCLAAVSDPVPMPPCPGYPASLAIEDDPVFLADRGRAYREFMDDNPGLGMFVWPTGDFKAFFFEYRSGPMVRDSTADGDMNDAIRAFFEREQSLFGFEPDCWELDSYRVETNDSGSVLEDLHYERTGVGGRVDSSRARLIVGTLDGRLSSVSMGLLRAPPAPIACGALDEAAIHEIVGALGTRWNSSCTNEVTFSLDDPIEIRGVGFEPCLDCPDGPSLRWAYQVAVSPRSGCSWLLTVDAADRTVIGLGPLCRC